MACGVAGITLASRQRTKGAFRVGDLQVGLVHSFHDLVNQTLGRRFASKGACGARKFLRTSSHGCLLWCAFLRPWRLLSRCSLLRASIKLFLCPAEHFATLFGGPLYLGYLEVPQVCVAGAQLGRWHRRSLCCSDRHCPLPRVVLAAVFVSRLPTSAFNVGVPAGLPTLSSSWSPTVDCTLWWQWRRRMWVFLFSRRLLEAVAAAWGPRLLPRGPPGFLETLLDEPLLSAASFPGAP